MTVARGGPGRFQALTNLWLAFLAACALAACAGPGQASVESLSGDNPTALAVGLTSLTGMRDGGKLKARVRFEGDAGWLEMDLEFQLGVPTVLSQGSWQAELEGRREQGGVTSRSVTFLGGQSDRPNLGGVFTLLAGDGSPRHRVRIPTSVVQRPGLQPSGQSRARTRSAVLKCTDLNPDLISGENVECASDRLGARLRAIRVRGQKRMNGAG